jgi:hypothetical protein
VAILRGAWLIGITHNRSLPIINLSIVQSVL